MSLSFKLHLETLSELYCNRKLIHTFWSENSTALWNKTQQTHNTKKLFLLVNWKLRDIWNLKVTDDKEKCDDEQLFIACATDQIGAGNISVSSALWWNRRGEKKTISPWSGVWNKKEISLFFTHYWDLPLTGTAGTARVTDHETDHETSSETGWWDEHWQGEWDLQVKLTVRQAGLLHYHRAFSSLNQHSTTACQLS